MPDRSHLAVGSVERILYLKTLPAFAGLAAADLSVIADHLRERYFAAGETLLREGEPVGSMYFLVDGAVRVARGGLPMSQTAAGAAVGGLEVLARTAEGVEAVATSDTLALELEADSFLEVSEDHFSILHHVIRDTCRLVIDAQRRTPLGPGPPLVPRDLRGPLHELDLVERIFFLRQIAPFRKSSVNALAELSRGLTEVRFDSGTTLWSEGDPSPSMLLVVNGSVRCTSSSRGFSFQIGRGGPVGSLEAVGETERWYEATVETPLVALQGSVEGLVDVFEDNYEIAMDYLAVVAQWLLAVMERERRHAAASAEAAARSGAADPGPVSSASA
jgi:CRP-like cAMP-binding protein